LDYFTAYGDATLEQYRDGGEAHGVAVNKMREQYPTAVMTGFFGREEYAKAAAEKANAILLTKI